MMVVVLVSQISNLLPPSKGLEKSFLKYSTGDFETMELFAEQISEDIATAFFPQYEVLVFTLLIEMLERGGGGERRGGGEGGRMRVERGVMVLIDYLLSHVRLEVSSLQTRGLALFAPVEARLISCHFSNSLSVTKRLVIFYHIFIIVFVLFLIRRTITTNNRNHNQICKLITPWTNTSRPCKTYECYSAIGRFL